MLTRRELLQRMAILTTVLPLSRLPDAPNNTIDVQSDTTNAQSTAKLNLAQGEFDMYFYYPDVATGWACKECYHVSNYCHRECQACHVIEDAIPENWTCPDCESTQAWAKRCSCHNAVFSIKESKINPFWLG